MGIGGSIKLLGAQRPCSFDAFSCIPKKIRASTIRITREDHVSPSRDLFAAMGEKGILCACKIHEHQNLGKKLWIFDQQVVFHVSHQVILRSLLECSPRCESWYLGVVANGWSQDFKLWMLANEILRQAGFWWCVQLNGEIHSHRGDLFSGDHGLGQPQ